mgnify:CR=1 FL=1
MNNLICLPNTPFGDPKYRKKWGIKLCETRSSYVHVDNSNLRNEDETINSFDLWNATLEYRKKNDSKWEVFERCALGNQDGEIDINISQYDLSSSILEMTQKHIDAKKNSNYIGKEKTNIFKLDTIIKKINLEKKK